MRGAFVGHCFFQDNRSYATLSPQRLFSLTSVWLWAFYVGNKPLGSSSRQANPSTSTVAGIAASFRATGHGWQARMNAALADWLKTHSPMDAEASFFASALRCDLIRVIDTINSPIYSRGRHGYNTSFSLLEDF
jgi:hypothetical protein